MGSWARTLGLGITVEDILDTIDDIKFHVSDFDSEEQVEIAIVEELKQEFDRPIKRQYSIPGNFGLKIDIDIANGGIGIEVKLASQLSKASEAQRLIGQAVYYRNKQYGDQIAVVIAGNEEEVDDPVVVELQEFLQELEISSICITARRR